MFKRKTTKGDRILNGWLLGTVVPLVIFMGVYLVKFSEFDFSTYLNNLWHMRVFFKIISLCVFPNLVFFMIFYRMKYDMAARGVIMATFIYACLVMFAKFIY